MEAFDGAHTSLANLEWNATNDRTPDELLPEKELAPFQAAVETETAARRQLAELIKTELRATNQRKRLTRRG